MTLQTRMVELIADGPHRTNADGFDVIFELKKLFGIPLLWFCLSIRARMIFESFITMIHEARQNIICRFLFLCSINVNCYFYDMLSCS